MIIKHGTSFTEIVFNSGGTEGNNTVLNSALQYFNEKYFDQSEDTSKDLPHIITCNVEHPSIENVLQQYERKHLAGNQLNFIFVLLIP